MRVGRPQQQSDVIRHLAHELAARAPRDVSPVPDPRERGSAGMSHATQHLQMSIFASNTPMALVVVDDALGVFRVHVYTELRESGMLLGRGRSHAHGLRKYEIARLRRGGRHLAGVPDAPLARGLQGRKIFPHFQSVALLREWGEALGAREDFRRAQGASHGDTSDR